MDPRTVSFTGEAADHRNATRTKTMMSVVSLFHASFTHCKLIARMFPVALLCVGHPITVQFSVRCLEWFVPANIRWLKLFSQASRNETHLSWPAVSAEQSLRPSYGTCEETKGMLYISFFFHVGKASLTLSLSVPV